MWLTRLSAAVLVVSVSLFSTVIAGTDNYESLHAQQLAKSGAPIKLDDAAYTAITKGPRDYSVAILLNALDVRFGCLLCRQIQPEWEMLSRSWLKGDKEGASQLVFGTIDFVDGRQAFEKLGLKTAPVLVLYHPTTGPHAKQSTEPERYDLGNGIAKADPLHAFLSRSLPGRPHPSLNRPFNYTRLAIFVTAVAGLVSAAVVAAPYLLPVIQNRNVWAAISLIAILLFNSGYMFNQIRGVPYVTGDKGRINYFVGGFQNQIGIETQIVAALYGILSFATINLALEVPRIADPRQQKIAVFIWTAVLLGVYSFLLSIFRIKNGGYPYRLPPFF